MKKIFALQISLLVLISIGGAAVFYYDVYDDIHDTIVSTLCLSCIKLDPISNLEFTFETGNNEPHAEFVLKNLTTGIVFIEYRTDVCAACDDMAPIVKDIFKVSFEKEDTLYKEVNYNGTTVHFYHINLDHATQEQKDSFPVYDKDVRQGVPMFVVATVNYHRGLIEPYYTTAYGTVGKTTEEGRKLFLESMIDDGLKFYDLNSAGYKYP